MDIGNVVDSVKKVIHNAEGEEIGFCVSMSELAEAIHISSSADVVKKNVDAKTANLVDEITSLKIKLQTLKTDSEVIYKKYNYLQAEFNLEAKKIAKKFGLDKFLKISTKQFDLKKLKKSCKSSSEVKQILEIYNSKFLPAIQVIEVNYKISDEEKRKLDTYNTLAREVNEKCLLVKKLLKNKALL